MQVDRESTPLTEIDVAVALRNAYLDLFGEDPSFEVLGVGWSQIALENAHGRAIWNNNFGNITGEGEAGDYYGLTTDEQVSPGEWKTLTMKYAAHPTPEAGARAYWHLITTRYLPAFDEFFRTGDAPGAAMKLHELGYFTANAAPIAATFGKLYEQFSDELGPSLGGLVHRSPKAGDAPCS